MRAWLKSARARLKKVYMSTCTFFCTLDIARRAGRGYAIIAKANVLWKMKESEIYSAFMQKGRVYMQQIDERVDEVVEIGEMCSSARGHQGLVHIMRG